MRLVPTAATETRARLFVSGSPKGPLFLSDGYGQTGQLRLFPTLGSGYELARQSRVSVSRSKTTPPAQLETGSAPAFPPRLLRATIN